AGLHRGRAVRKPVARDEARMRIAAAHFAWVVPGGTSHLSNHAGRKNATIETRMPADHAPFFCICREITEPVSPPRDYNLNLTDQKLFLQKPTLPFSLDRHFQ